MVMIFLLLSHLQAIETDYYPTQAVQTKQCVLSDKCFVYKSYISPDILS